MSRKIKRAVLSIAVLSCLFAQSVFTQKVVKLNKQTNVPKIENQTFTVPIDEQGNTGEVSLKLYRDVGVTIELTNKSTKRDEQYTSKATRSENVLITAGHCVSKLLIHGNNTMTYFTAGEFFVKKNKKTNQVGKLIVLMDPTVNRDFSISAYTLKNMEKLNEKANSIEEYENFLNSFFSKDYGAIYITPKAKFLISVGKKDFLLSAANAKKIFNSFKDGVLKIRKSVNIAKNPKTKIKIGLKGKLLNMERAIFGKDKNGNIINKIFLLFYKHDIESMFSSANESQKKTLAELFRQKNIMECSLRDLINSSFSINTSKFMSRFPPNIGQFVIANTPQKSSAGDSGTGAYDKYGNFIGILSGGSSGGSTITLMSDENARAIKGYIKKGQSYYQ